MAQAYTPGLKVRRCMRYRCRRLLPIPGDVLVKVGDHVDARQVVAETYLPGDVTPINLANVLSVPPSDLPDLMLKKEGERVEVGEPIARTKGLFGLFRSEYRSKVAGTIETISSVTGQLIIRGEPVPVRVLAYVTGTVVEVIPDQGVVIESDVTYIQGIFGIGGEAYGPIRMACADHTEELHEDHIHEDMKGAVVVGGSRMTGKAVRRAIEVGASAVVSGGMDDQDLREILGYDLGVAITGSERIGLTLIITEGFGEIAMAEKTFKLLLSREGAEASVNGATQIRAGVQRPEIVIPWPAGEAPEEPEEAEEAGVLKIGTPVRIIRDPHFGVLGKVVELPPEPQVLESESKARVLVVESQAGERIVVPRANVEIAGG